MKALVALEQSETADKVVSFASSVLDADDQVLVVNVVGAHAPEWTAGAGLAGYGAIHPGWAVATPPPVDGDGSSEQARGQALASQATDTLGTGTAVTEVGDPTEQVLGLAAEHEVDLIIVGTEDPGMLERIFTGGSVSREIVDRASCSVLVVR